MATFSGGKKADQYTGGSTNDSIDGNGGNDTLTGAAGDDTINGGDGNDIIFDSFGGSADTASDMDFLYGGAGNDIIVSNQGLHFLDVDQIYGGTGDDWIKLVGAQTDDMADGGVGTDRFELDMDESLFQSVVAHFNLAGFQVQVGGVNTVFASGFESLWISTGTGADIVDGSDLDDSFRSTGGSDLVHLGAGNDAVSIDLSFASAAMQTETLDGGIGTDSLGWSVQVSLTDAHVFDLKAGVFTRAGVSLGTFTGFELLYFSGGAGADKAVGGDLDDVLNGGDGNDTLIGGLGDDNLSGDGGADKIFGGGGDDDIDADPDGFFGDPQSKNEVYGGSGNDTMSGGDLADTFDGGSGDDVYYIGTGDVVIDGGGIDWVFADLSTFNFRQYAGIEKVTMLGFGGTVIGNGVANDISAGSGAFTANAGAGDDTVNGGTTGDQIFGENGNDRLNGNGGTDAVYGGSGDDLAYGGQDGDTLQGDDGNDTLYGDYPTGVAGTGGIDRLYGGAGDDALYGGDLNDYLYGGTGHDTLNGGSGIDLAGFAGATQAVDLSLAVAGAQANGNGGTVMLVDIEGFLGSSFNDTLKGNGADNSLNGLGGNDALSGGAGIDTLFAGTGADRLTGGGGCRPFRVYRGAQCHQRRRRDHRFHGGSGYVHPVQLLSPGAVRVGHGGQYQDRRGGDDHGAASDLQSRHGHAVL